MKMYAIFSWDSEHGPIKSWDRMRSVEIHNGRVKPIAHGNDGAPPPDFLVGSPNIAADVRKRLIGHQIDPDRIRNGGVIAHEAVITASREFFAMGSEEERRTRLVAWTEAQVDFVTQRYGSHRVASMVLHQDEHTPHIHAVVVPLKYATDGRHRGEPQPYWRLDGQVLTARGELRQLQTDYGRAMAPLGLSRGEPNSENKHQSYSVAVADLEAERAAIRMREAELLAQQRGVEQAMVHLRDGWIQIIEEKREIASARAAVVKLLEEVKRREIEYEGLLVRETRLRRHEELIRERERAVEAREKASQRVLDNAGSQARAAGRHMLPHQPGPAIW